MDPALIALIGTVFGGAGFKMIEHFLSKATTKDNTATSLRTELRDQVAELKKDNGALREEVDGWRNRYYRLVSAVAGGDLAEAIKTIKEDKP